MSWDEEPIHLGNVEIGEALRGMQGPQGAYGLHGRSAIGAAQAQRQLRGALAQLAGGHFDVHAPVQKQVRSAYKDSTQFGIALTGVFAATAWTAGNTTLPTISGKTRVYESFKPLKAIIDESLLVTYTNASLGSTTVAVDVPDGGDLIIISVFAGAKNCFPTAPDQSTGISGRSISNNSLGNGVSWPTINGGIDMVITMAVKRTAAFRSTPPAGYTSANIATIEVDAIINLFGESLRP